MHPLTGGCNCRIILQSRSDLLKPEFWLGNCIEYCSCELENTTELTFSVFDPVCTRYPKSVSIARETSVGDGSCESLRSLKTTSHRGPYWSLTPALWVPRYGMRVLLRGSAGLVKCDQKPSCQNHGYVGALIRISKTDETIVERMNHMFSNRSGQHPTVY